VLEANVEIIKRGWEAFEKGGVEAIYPFYSEDCVIVDAPEIPDAMTRHGWEGLRAVLENFTEMWDQLTLRPVEFIDASEDTVIAVYAMEGSGKESGTPVEAPVVLVYDLAGGVIVRQRIFLSREAALESAKDQGNRAE
jgi:ketosteroid isomerase-like protein